jgi:hypothetical protein
MVVYQTPFPEDGHYDLVCFFNLFLLFRLERITYYIENESNKELSSKVLLVLSLIIFCSG